MSNCVLVWEGGWKERKYPSSIQLVAGLVSGQKVFYKYPTGCWLGEGGGRILVPYQYPTRCCFCGWEGGILPVSNLLMVGWGIINQHI